MLDHPITQKFLLAIASAAFVGVGGVAWNSNLKLERHDVRLGGLVEADTRIQNDVINELKEIRRDVTEIKTSVAVIKERTTALEKDAELHSRDRPGP